MPERRASEAGGAHLLLGPEIGEKSQHVDHIRKVITKQSGGEPEEHRLYADETAITEVLPLMRTSSLFSGHTLVVYRGAEQIKGSAESQALSDFLKSPPDEATLVLISEEHRIKQSWTKAIPKERTRIFWEMFDNQKKGWVAAFCRRRSVEIEEDASELLLELVENNTLALGQELERLCDFVGRGERITADVVESYLYHSKDESVFSLFDYVATGQLDHALEILSKLLLTSDNHPIQILAGMIWQLRRLRDFKALLDSRYDQAEAFGQLNIRAKRTQRIYAEGAGRYSRGQLDRMLALAADYDAELRGGLAQWGGALLQQFLYYCIVKRGERPLVAGVAGD